MTEILTLIELIILKQNKILADLLDSKDARIRIQELFDLQCDLVRLINARSKEEAREAKAN